MADDSLRPRPPKPQSWDDVFAITGGLHGIPVKEIETGELLWDYEFGSKDMRPCGREGCNTPHGHGWIVELKEGRFVHIGKDCAKAYANADRWRAKVGVYNERQRRSAQDRAFCDAREQAQSILHWLDNNAQLKLSLQLYRSILAELPAPLLDDLRKRAERRNADVTREHKLSEAEISRRREAQTVIREDGTTQIPYVSAVDIILRGRLRGLSCFRNEIDRLERSIENDALFLLRRSHIGMSKSERDDLSRRIMNMKNNKRTLENSMSELALFLDPSNLKLLASTETAKRQGLLEIAVHDGTIAVMRRQYWESGPHSDE